MESGQAGEWRKQEEREIDSGEIVILQVKLFQGVQVHELLYGYVIVTDIKELEILLKVHQVLLPDIHYVLSVQLRSDGLMWQLYSARIEQ